MKTWKKPELLNLMLQETKDGTSTIYGDWHTCKQTGEVHTCKNNNDPTPDTCEKGHGNLKYTEDGMFLVSCCS